MLGRYNQAFVLVGFLLMLQAPSHAASITLTSPTSGQAYAPGVGINYAGYGSWNLSVTPKENRTTNVSVTLVWNTPGANPPTLGQGVIVDSDGAVITYDYDNNRNYTGNYSFAASINATTGDPNLVATQYSSNGTPQPTAYYLIAQPFAIHNIPYPTAPNAKTYVARTLALGPIQ